MYVRRSDLFSAQYIEEDGMLLALNGEFKVKKGQWVLSNDKGILDIVNEDEFKKNYISVIAKTRVGNRKELSPFEEQYFEQMYHDAKLENNVE